MGQYYYICNLKKRQYLHAHKFGDGLKLMEFGMSGSGTMAALAVLLANGNGRGGGDLGAEHPLIGSWAGDPIVIAGDYADKGKFLSRCKKLNLYHYAKAHFEDISDQIADVLCQDRYFKEAYDDTYYAKNREHEAA